MSIELVGSNLVIAKFIALPRNVRLAVEKKALQESAKLLKNEIEKNAPVLTGTLKKSIGFVIRKPKKGYGDDSYYAYVGPRNEYAHKEVKYRDFSEGKGTEHIVEYIDKKGVKRTKKMHYKVKTKQQRYVAWKNPAVRYAHLADKGTAIRTNKKGANRGSVAGVQFMQRSVDAVRDQIQTIFKDTLDKEWNNF